MTNSPTRKSAGKPSIPKAARPSEPTTAPRPTEVGSPPAPPGAGSEGSARQNFLRYDFHHHAPPRANRGHIGVNVLIPPEGAASAFIVGVTNTAAVDEVIIALRKVADMLEGGL